MLLLRSHETFLCSQHNQYNPVSVLIHPRNTHFNPVFAVLYGLEDQTHYQVNEVNPRPTYLLVEPEHNKPAKHENKNHEH